MKIYYLPGYRLNNSIYCLSKQEYFLINYISNIGNSRSDYFEITAVVQLTLYLHTHYVHRSLGKQIPDYIVNEPTDQILYMYELL